MSRRKRKKKIKQIRDIEALRQKALQNKVEESPFVIMSNTEENSIEK